MRRFRGHEAVLLAAQHHVVFEKSVPAFLYDFRVLRRELRRRVGIDKLGNLAYQVFRAEFQ